MTSRSQSSHRFRWYREIPNDRAEVLVPEQPTMSIKVEVAQQVAAGLHALVLKHLAKAAKKQKNRTRSGNSYTNKIDQPVSGTVIQIGRMDGDFHGNSGR
jgi:hypothetical protein